MSETRTAEIANKEDPYKLTTEIVKIGNVDVSLVSCDHLSFKQPKNDPWREIENQVKQSSLIFVEYFPWELEKKAYNNPIWGKLARTIGEGRDINSFFNSVAKLCVENNKQLAVADIATDSAFTLNQTAMRALPAMALATTLTPENQVPIFIGMQLLAMGAVTQEVLGIGMFDKERKDFERWFPDMEDARRLLTARGIAQEAERRTSDARFMYIGPHAHVSRIKWYLEHPQDKPTKIKGKVYSLAVGLPKSTRIYKPIENHSWQLISDVPTRI